MQPENIYPRRINFTLFDQINCLSDQMKVANGGKEGVRAQHSRSASHVKMIRCETLGKGLLYTSVGRVKQTVDSIAR